MNIVPSRPILVTGATGFVGSWIVKMLLEQGYNVRAAIRNSRDKRKTEHLEKIAQDSKGEIQYFESDLIVKDSFAEAMKGCELVFHTASPILPFSKSPMSELILPIVNGTKNILQTVSDVKTVKKIIFTSSSAAMYTDARDCLSAPKGFLDEEVWNQSASLTYQPYFYAKTLAEKKAWSIANNQSKWELISINPSFILGPILNVYASSSESIQFIHDLYKGRFRFGVPKLGIGLVDVRDVAEAHLQAAFNPSANGRYLVSGYNTNFYDMIQCLIPKYGNTFPISKRKLSKWFVLLTGPLFHKSISRKFLRNNVDIAWRGDSSKAIKDLNLQFKPMSQTMEEGFQSIIDYHKNKR